MRGSPQGPCGQRHFFLPLEPGDVGEAWNVYLKSPRVMDGFSAEVLTTDTDFLAPGGSTWLRRGAQSLAAHNWLWGVAWHWQLVTDYLGY